jgi:hypothetical protein
MMKKSILSAIILLGFAATVRAQQRPLVTEDPETIGSGLILIEGGLDYQHQIFYPASGLEGNLLRLGLWGVSFGVSSIAEIQIDGGVYNRLAVTARQPAPLSGETTFTGDTTDDVEDTVVATKIRLVSEAPGRPAFGVRFATRLPDAGNESGLGLDTMDFYVSGLIGKTVESIRMVGNFGFGLLPDPVEGSRQNDVLTYGFSLARALLQGVEIVGEINGRANFRKAEDTPPGTQSRSVMRIGGRFTHGTVRFDGVFLVGLTSRDPSYGFGGGFTWVFRGFRVP